jgi:hypothetical protein
MIIGDEARVMECKHTFHKQCLDEWLRVNASCPTCRKSIYNDENNPNNTSNHTTLLPSNNNNQGNININSMSSPHQIRLNFSIADRSSNQI